MKVSKSLLSVLITSMVAVNAIANPVGSAASPSLQLKQSAAHRMESISPSIKLLAMNGPSSQPLHVHKTPTTNKTSSQRLHANAKPSAPPIALPEADLVEPVLSKGAQFLVGEEKGEFYVVAKDEVAPKIETKEEKVIAASKASRAAEMALNETADLFNKVKAVKLEKRLEVTVHPAKTQVQATDVMPSTLKQPPSTLEAENEVKVSSVQLIEHPEAVSDVAPVAVVVDNKTVKEVNNSSAAIKSVVKQTVTKKMDMKTVLVKKSSESKLIAVKATKNKVAENKPATHNPKIEATAKTDTIVNSKEKHRHTLATKKHAKTHVTPRQVHATKSLRATSKQSHKHKVAAKSKRADAHLSLAPTEKKIVYRHTVFEVKRVQLSD